MADMNMCNRFDFISNGKVTYSGTQFTEYEDVEQPKQEEEKKPFSAASVVGNVLGAIAVGVVVGAAIGFFAVAGMFTGGAAWVVGAAIAGAVATTVAAKAVSQGVEDCKEGKTTSTTDYLSSAFDNAVKVGGQITDGLDKVLFIKGVVKNAGKKLMLKAFKRGGNVPPKIPNPPKKGGAYKDVPADGGEAHHMPADSVSPLSRGRGPATRMETKDHYATASWGRSKEAQAYRDKQKQLIKEGKFKEAQQMDIDDLHKKFGDKYNEGIEDMEKYTEEIKDEISNAIKNSLK